MLLPRIPRLLQLREAGGARGKEPFCMHHSASLSRLAVGARVGILVALFKMLRSQGRWGLWMLTGDLEDS